VRSQKRPCALPDFPGFIRRTRRSSVANGGKRHPFLLPSQPGSPAITRRESAFRSQHSADTLPPLAWTRRPSAKISSYGLRPQDCPKCRRMGQRHRCRHRERGKTLGLTSAAAPAREPLENVLRALLIAPDRDIASTHISRASRGSNRPTGVSRASSRPSLPRHLPRKANLLQLAAGVRRTDFPHDTACADAPPRVRVACPPPTLAGTRVWPKRTLNSRSRTNVSSHR